jgi:hypothetical protein
MHDSPPRHRGPLRTTNADLSALFTITLPPCNTEVNPIQPLVVPCALVRIETLSRGRAQGPAVTAGQHDMMPV